jgi:plasmid stabilization system protein ParE
MAGFRLSKEAEADLDSIWLYIVRESGSIDVANRVVDSISERFWLLARHPFIGRSRDRDLRPGLRSLVADDYVIIHRVEDTGVVLILHVLPGSRDIVSFLRDSIA